MAKLAGMHPWPWRDRLMARMDALTKGTESGPPLASEHETEAAELGRLMSESAKLPTGEIVGGVLALPYADGYAYYIVTKAKPLTLRWIPYCDAWQVPDVYIRGLRLEDVRSMLHVQKKRFAR